MKKTNTLLLMAAAIIITSFAQAQGTAIRTAEELRNSGFRQMVQKKNKETQSLKALPEQKNMRNLAEGPAMSPAFIIFQEYDEASQQWLNNQRFSYIYENGIYEKEVILELYEGDDLIPYEKRIHFYNANWELQEVDIYYYEPSEKSWQLAEKELTHTDEHGNLVLEANLMLDTYSQQWDTLNAVKINYDYTAFGLPQEIIFSVYFGWTQEWMELYMELYTYDEANRVQDFIAFYRDEDKFVPEFREEYFYDLRNEWSEVLVYSWFYDEWFLEFKVGEFDWFDFAAEKHLHYIVFMPGFDVEWEPYYRSIALYHPVSDEQILLLEEDFDYWLDEWIPYYREITNFDANNMPAQYTVEYYQDDEWVLWIGIRNTYQLNANGYPTENIVEWYDSHYTSTWINWMKLLFEYDAVTGVPVTKQPVIQAQAYPNPVTNYTNLVVDQNYEILVLSVLNLMGQEISKQVYRSVEANSPITVDFSRQPPGIYFVQMQSGSQSQLLKMVKK